MKGFRPDHRTSRSPTDVAARHAYGELRRRILDGRLPQGTVVNEVAMAESIGVSRTPLREAFRELLNEGLLEGNGPRRQVTVRSLGPDDLAEVLRARRALAKLVAASAAKRVDEQVTDELRLISARMGRAASRGDTAAFLEADDEFHHVLSKSAGATTVEDFLSRLRSLMRLEAMARSLRSDHMAELEKTHERVVDLLTGRDSGRGRAIAAELARCAESVIADPPD